MPLPSDEALLKLSQDLVAQLQTLAGGKHAGYRPAHARGILVNGTFTPTAEAAALSKAPHFHSASTPVTIRFSNSGGLPNTSDTDPGANPRGIAIRFNLPSGPDGRRKHTDVIAHSTPFFPARTGAEFLELLRALGASPPGTPSPSPAEVFLGSHPAALAFVTAPKPSPSSFVREPYWGLTALKFINAEGKEQYFRFRIVPDAGVDPLSEAALKEKDENYLFDELPKRLTSGEAPSTFSLVAQLADEGDKVDDVTLQWPETRRLVTLGTVKLEGIAPDSAAGEKRIIFDPIPRIEGIEPSDDPLLELRAAVYLISGGQRR